MEDTIPYPASRLTTASQAAFEAALAAQQTLGLTDPPESARRLIPAAMENAERAVAAWRADSCEGVAAILFLQ